ncbi:MAG: hypothetical protein EKK48_29060 [Candidatus Melainabacteria bacterium]|nr:MAG: hypothetical protein EKK48_29060 [Candidatus Melainabacteria bacterium]
MPRIIGSLVVSQKDTSAKFVLHEPTTYELPWHMIRNRETIRAFLEKFSPACSVQTEGMTIYSVDCDAAELEDWFRQQQKN